MNNLRITFERCSSRDNTGITTFKYKQWGIHLIEENIWVLTENEVYVEGEFSNFMEVQLFILEGRDIRKQPWVRETIGIKDQIKVISGDWEGMEGIITGIHASKPDESDLKYNVVLNHPDLPDRTKELIGNIVNYDNERFNVVLYRDEIEKIKPRNY